MTVPTIFLDWLIGIATLIVAVSPVLLIVLLIIDWKRKQLW